MVDVVILGATEVDLDFNANVVTHSDGYLLHGLGGWQNCLFSKTVILPVPLFRDRVPVIRDRVTTLCGPGELIDVIVLHVIAGLFSERGGLSVPEFEQVISETLRNAHGGKSVLVALDDAYRFEGTEKAARELRQAGLLSYVSMRSTCRALRRAASYREFLSRAASRNAQGS